MKKCWMALAACLPLLATLPARADSIWQRRDPRAAFLFEDNLARRVGDLLTVEINETTNANEREQRAMDKGSNTKASIGGKSGSGSSSASFEGSSSRQFNGSAQLSADRKFIDRITVAVVDVQPNGNLVIEGYRSRMVASEERVLRITGIVRPADISVNNTVESRLVANFKISYLGRGPQSSFTNQSWFGRIMNKLWPF